jgi:hypothetical protein
MPYALKKKANGKYAVLKKGKKAVGKKNELSKEEKFKAMKEPVC